MSELDAMISAAIEPQEEDTATDAPINETPVETEIVEEQPTEADTQEQQEKTIEELQFTAPDKWSGFAKTKFARLPQDIQKELLAYHSDYEGQRKTFDALNNIIEPVRDAVTQTYGSLEGMVNHYIGLDKAAATDPAGLVRWFMQQRGLTPESVFGQTAAQPKTDANDPFAYFEKQISDLKAQLQTQGQESSQRELERQAFSQIEQFSKDPKYPYFNDLRPEIAGLMQSGQAKDLAEAYEKAVWLNPKTRAEVLEQEKEASRKKAEEQARKAKQAASIKAAPTGAPQKSGSKPIDEIIYDAMDARV